METKKGNSSDESKTALEKAGQLEDPPKPTPASIKFTLGIYDTKPPQHHVRASVTLRSEDPVNLNKAAHIKLSTWFLSIKDVDIGLFAKEESDGRWKKLESVLLTDSKSVGIHLRVITNVTAYLPTKHLGDVSIRLKPYFYHNDKGSFKVGAMPCDEVCISVLANYMEKAQHIPLLGKNVKEMVLDIGDEIRYSLPNKQLKGKVIIDEGFLQEFMSYVQTHVVKAIPPRASLEFRHVRVAGGRNQVVDEMSYPVVIRQNTGGLPDADIEFCGEFEAENVLNSVGDIYIDQRTAEGDTTGISSKHETDDMFYEAFAEVGQHEVPAGYSLASPIFTVKAKGEPSTRPSRIRFLGNVKVKNMISNAGNVTIDQRRIHRRPGGASRDDNPTTKTAVQAEGDLREQGQRRQGVEHHEININVGSDRTFRSTPKTEGRQEKNTGMK